MYHRDRGAPERLFGFFTLDPYRRRGELVGGQLHQIRFEPTRIWGVYYTVVAWAAEWLRERGLAHLALGACVLDEVERREGLPRFWGAELLGQLAHDHLDRFHSMTRLTQMKLTFPGRSIRRFLAGPARLPLAPLVRLMAAARLIVWPWEAP